MSRPGRIRAGADIVDATFEVDYVVVGSGPGGSTAAAVLAAAGAKVAVLEEGGHYTRRDFNMQEGWAYPALYQEHGNRATEDLSIMVLQGRSVGGGTTVNWTSSFRTPDRTLALWAARHGVRGLDAATLAPALRRRRAAARARPRQPGRRERQQPQASRRRGQAGLAPRADPPQREGVRPPRLLRDGLPAGCQAHGANDVPGRRRRRRRRRLRRLPCDADRKRSRPRPRRHRRGAGPRERSPARATGRLRQARRGAGRRRDQHPRLPAARPRRRRQRPGRPANVPAPDRPRHRVLRPARRGVLRRPAVRRRSPVRRPRRSRRLHLRDGARPPDAGRAGVPGVRRHPPPDHAAPAVRAGDHRPSDRRSPRRSRAAKSASAPTGACGCATR